MNTVRLSADGAIRRADGTIGEDPLPLLGKRVQLEDGYTLRSFFSMLGRHPVLCRMGEFLAACAGQAANSPPHGCRTDDFTHLELSKTVEMVGHPGERRLDIYTSLRGMGGGEAREIRFMAFDVLLDMPVRLGRLRHIVLGDAMSVLEFDTAYSLFEFIEGVAWNLGFHGAPKQCSLRG